MNVKKIITLLLAALLVLSLAACGKQGSDDTTKPDGEPKNAQEAAAMYKDLMDQENAILTENQSLWEKVFQSADKGMTTQEDGKNYGDFLLDTIESDRPRYTLYCIYEFQSKAGSERSDTRSRFSTRLALQRGAGTQAQEQQAGKINSLHAAFPLGLSYLFAKVEGGKRFCWLGVRA